MIVQSGSTDLSPAELASLLCVSRVAIDPDQLAWALADIQTRSVARNTAHDITGLLIATQRYFAQFMEGSSDALDTVMSRILADSRHNEIRIAQRAPIAGRIGSSWRLIRFEPGSFEERHVTPVIERAHREGSDGSTRALLHLVHRLLARPAGPASQSGPRGIGSAKISEQ